MKMKTGSIFSISQPNEGRMAQFNVQFIIKILGMEFISISIALVKSVTKRHLLKHHFTEQKEYVLPIH